MTGKQSPFNILHFAFCYFPVYGGMSTRLHNMLSDGLHNHILYVPQAPNAYLPKEYNGFPEEERFTNITAKRRSFSERGNRKIPLIDYVGDMIFHEKFAKEFIDTASLESVDLVYGHTPLHFGYAAMKYAKINKLPFIHEAHAFMHDTVDLSQFQGLKYLYHKFFNNLLLARERAYLAYADRIISQTEIVKARIMNECRIPESKITVIPNGVDTLHFDPEKHAQSGRRIRQESGWQNKKVFLYSGLLDTINGIDFYLEALKAISLPDQQRMVAVFLGRGPLENEVKCASEQLPHVQFLGRVSYEEMPSYYSAADVFVIPRPSCGPAETLMPMKLYEAMAMTLDVLVSDVKPMKEAVQNGSLGRLYPKDSMDKLIEGLTHMITTSGDESIRRKARETVIADHSWQKAHRALHSLYESII